MSKGKKEEEKTVSKKRKGLGVKSLISSDENGSKLAGVLKIFGEIEKSRNKDIKTQSITNKVSKAGLKLRATSDEDLAKDENIVKAMGIISKNFAGIKDCIKNEDAKFTDEMQEAYDILLGFGRKGKFEDIPDTISF